MSPDLKKSVVRITSRDPNNSYFGTGFIIDQDEQAAYMLTCAHVVQDVGSEMLEISAIQAKVIASGSEDDIDLAVLRVEGLLTEPPLPLYATGDKGNPFSTAGFQSYGKGFLIRELHGTLGEQVGLETRRQTDRIKAWDLEITGEYLLQPGYSGSPVVDEYQHVIGIVNTRRGEGKKGLAISIEALEKVWPETAPRLFERSGRREEELNKLSTITSSVPQIEPLSTISSQTAVSARESTPQKTVKQPGYEGAAIPNFEDLLEEPTNVHELIGRFLPSRTPAYDKGEALKELRHYEEKLATDPRNVEVLSKKGNVLYGLKRYPEALAAYEEVIRLDSNNVPAYSQKGDVLYARESYKEALTAYEEALRLDPTYLAAYTGKGDALHSLKRNEEALAAYDDAIEFGSPSESNLWGNSYMRDPAYVRAYGGKGKVLFELERFGEAFAAYETIKRLDPFNHAYDSEMENVRALMKREAIASAEQAVRQNPGDASVRYNKGNVLYQFGDYKGALVAYDQALKLDSKFAAAHYKRAFVLLYLAQSSNLPTDMQSSLDLYGLFRGQKILLQNAKPYDKDYDNALAAYREAKRLDPHPTYFNERLDINALETLERLEKADIAATTRKHAIQEELEAAEQAIAQNPKDAQAYCKKGDAHFKLGQDQAALAAYNQALQFDSKLLAALVGKGDVLRKNRFDEEALAVYDQALKLDPSHVDALYGKGDILLTLKRNKEALAIFNKYLENKDDLAIVHYKKSLALRRLGKTQAANVAYKKAKLLGWGEEMEGREF